MAVTPLEHAAIMAAIGGSYSDVEVRHPQPKLASRILRSVHGKMVKPEDSARTLISSAPLRMDSAGGAALARRAEGAASGVIVGPTGLHGTRAPREVGLMSDSSASVSRPLPVSGGGGPPWSRVALAGVCMGMFVASIR